jgi:hypothetical protein
MNEHAFYPVRVRCHADIFKNIDTRFAQDLVNIIENLSETGRAKLRQLYDNSDNDGMGKFLTLELLHYRANRGQS